MSIFERMINVNLDASGLKFVKSKFVEVTKAQGKEPAKGYYIIPISDILEPLRSLYAKHGLFIQPSEIKYNPANGESRRNMEIGNFKTPTWVANAHVDFIVYSAEGETIETTVSCEAKDTVGSDKLTNKLYTNAIRNYLRITHMIDGDEAQDPEETNGAAIEEPTPKREPAINDPFFGKKEKEPIQEVKQEVKQEPKQEVKQEPKKEPTPEKADTFSRESALKIIEERIKSDPEADETARGIMSFYRKRTFAELNDDALKDILTIIGGA